jgi:beta-galactosidase
LLYKNGLNKFLPFLGAKISPCDSERNHNFEDHKNKMKMKRTPALLIALLVIVACSCSDKTNDHSRECTSINDGWRFFKYETTAEADHLMYDVRPETRNPNEVKDADSRPTEAVEVEQQQMVLKPWILPSANDFIKNEADKHIRPEGNPGSDFPFVQASFDDSQWAKVELPHDWAIAGPFQEGWDSEVSGGMGRLPVNGVGWYRRKLDIPATDAGKMIYLDIDGAMSYAMVWLNGNLVGGWPYGYNSWRLDLTPYLDFGGENQLAIRVDNPNYSARWYPGAGLYRYVWLTKTNPVHVAQWGTFITSSDVSEQTAKVQIEINIENKTSGSVYVEAFTEIFVIDGNDKIKGKAVTSFEKLSTLIEPGSKAKVNGFVSLDKPCLWGLYPPSSPTGT